MRVKTQLAALRAKCGHIERQEVSIFTGIAENQLSDLESGEAQAIEFGTLAKLCLFFKCTPNDLLALEAEPEDSDGPTADELAKADEIIKRAFARAEAMPPRPPEEIWTSFEATLDRIAEELPKSEPAVETQVARIKSDG
ncbi:helix-turn-helix domain-containing protein [Kamptonema formosum]|uniref:helix-turn-helix domain-containing protein n=1 Tax=Kamptonema formosum TaxID=331992 RepID=UPI000348710F|nr:helix-turn-helix transcriptional regulator [Oscillatoria sp. PCC 10802]